MSKWLVGHLPTGTVMKKWKQRIHDWCPHCQQDQEDILHLTTCPSQAVTNFWAQRLTALKDWMEQKDTNQDLQTSIIDSLTSWLQDPYDNEISLSHFPPTQTNDIP